MHIVLGRVAILRGAHDAARALFTESLGLLAELGNTRRLAEPLEGVARVFALQGQPARSAWLLGVAAAVRERTGRELQPTSAFAAAHQHTTATVRGALGEVEFTAAFAAGRASSLEAAVAEVLAMDSPA